MRGVKSQCVLLLQLVLLTVSSVLLAAADDNNNNNQCGMYIAISATSTVDDTKWGLYAGKEYPKGSQLGYPDVSINMFNLQGNARAAEEPSEEDADWTLVQNTVEFFEQFIWVPIANGGSFELENGRTVTAIPGAGVLGGYNPKLTNADWNHTAAFFRPALGEQPGVNHPGRGAYSNFFNVALRSKDKITAGMEIYLDYGDNWEEETKDEDLTTEDFEKLDATIDRMIAFFDKYEGELDEKARVDIYDFLIRDVMGAATGSAKGRKIADLLPAYPESLAKVKETGGSLAFSRPMSHRSIEWLEQHGRCIDQIRPGASTIPNAGRGAFATRKIEKGGVVSPVPLVHLPASSIIEMHEIGSEDDHEEDGPVYYKLSDEVTGEQLLTNYLWGHPQSTMMFFPAGSVTSLINHSKKPNAKMIWSNHPGHQKHWLDLSPEQLLSQDTLYLGLMMEIVALRDIEEGEEVFIDYGNEWQAAWDEYVNEWETMVAKGEIPKEWPLMAIDLNQQFMSKPYKTPEELSADPYPTNVMMKCFLQIQQAAATKKIDGKVVKEWTAPPQGVLDSDMLEDCSIYDRVAVNDGSAGLIPYNYTISVQKGAASGYIANVPHRAIVFVDKPGTGDQFIRDPFRHYIGIPDDVFPQGPWRDFHPDAEEQQSQTAATS